MAENRHLPLTGGIALTTVYALTCYTVIILPAPKVGRQPDTSVADFRPIPVTSVVSRITERLVVREPMTVCLISSSINAILILEGTVGLSDVSDTKKSD